MPNLTSDKWESSKIFKSEIPLDINEYKTEKELKEEIKPSDLAKLMYVAMTRAKHTLRLSYPETINKKVKKATKFLVNIQEDFQKEDKPFEYDENSYWTQVANLLIKKTYDYKKDFNKLIKTKLNDRAYSPSAINRYLSCPRKYFYNDILELCAKDGNPNATSYGSAIHKALEKTIKFIKENKSYPEKSQIISWFKDELSNLPMENFEQRKNYEKRGENALDNYYCQITNIIPDNLVGIEENVECEFEGVKFKGYIDRIDKNEDGTYTIYDYKTGNNKNYDIGIDKNHEDYYNQMAWYKFFYELKTGNTVSITKFIYPEDFESKNNGIEYTKEESEERIEKFKSAIKNIENCNFEPSFNKNACKYCQYSDFCKINAV